MQLTFSNNITVKPLNAILSYTLKPIYYTCRMSLKLLEILILSITNSTPLWFYTDPEKIEFNSNNSVLELFEQQVRGGASTGFHRNAEANSKYLPNYEKDEEISYATNRYRNKLCQNSSKWKLQFHEQRRHG